MAERIEQFVSRHEKTISAASGIATALGLICAAFSAYASYQQLRLINRERLTPYRAIVYTAKLEAYRKTSSAVLAYKRQTYYHYPDFFAAYDKYGLQSLELAKTAQVILNERDAFIDALTENSPVWPEALSEYQYQVIDDARKLAECAEAVTIKGADQRFFDSMCDQQRIATNFTRFERNAQKYVGTQRAEIRADQFQDVAPTNE